MLYPDKPSSPIGNRDEDGDIREVVDFEKIIAIVRRQWRLVAIMAVVFVIIGVAYVLTAVPLYTATASLLIDRGSNGIVNKLAMDEVSTDDEASILSQVEVLKSDTVTAAVIDKLKLVDNPVFMASNISLLSTVRTALSKVVGLSSFISDPTKIAAAKKHRKAMENFQDAMTITRVGRSYVLNIGFTSPSSELAANIASAIADQYLVDKLDSKYDSTRRATDWLQDRIDELKQKALATDLAVQKFRAENGLLASGGQLYTDQRLSELNSALIGAQAETAKAKAKYERIEHIVDSGQSDAVVAEALDSAVSNDLRQKYFAASKLEADIESRLGADHQRAMELRAEMDEYKRLMFEEVKRIAQSYKSEYDVALSREQSVSENVAQANKASATAGETGVQLRELERAAETYKNLYQTFLQRYQEAIQQQSFPITEARVITRPDTPDRPSFPRKTIVLAMFGVVGAALGGALGGLRELRDRYFRTGEQIRNELHLEFLGSAPLVKPVAVEAAKFAQGSRFFQRTSNMSNLVIEHPMSAFAETLRSAKIAVNIGRRDGPANIVGVVSALPGEGKSTISINFAELLASQGSRTLLIDCDFRNPGATRAIGRHADAGIIEAITEGRRIEDLILFNEVTKLWFLPAAMTRRVPHSAELLASDAMQKILQYAQAKFDYIVLDLPPLAPVVDARIVVSYVDSVLMVIEWGQTSRRVVRSTLSNFPEVYNKCAGVILNKVDADKMKMYRSFGSSDHYYSRYSSYYQEG